MTKINSLILSLRLHITKHKYITGFIGVGFGVVIVLLSFAVTGNNPDKDDDGVLDTKDNCIRMSNADQKDEDKDGAGDVCDNCMHVSNESQNDDDFDTIGNECDNCPLEANTDQKDSDRDTIGDACDTCPNVKNPDQKESDGDSIGDECDNCKEISNKEQVDTDNDSIGDSCDTCPSLPNENQNDRDNDGMGDLCDECPLIQNADVCKNLIAHFPLDELNYNKNKCTGSFNDIVDIHKNFTATIDCSLYENCQKMDSCLSQDIFIYPYKEWLSNAFQPHEFEFAFGPNALSTGIIIPLDGIISLPNEKTFWFGFTVEFLRATSFSFSLNQRSSMQDETLLFRTFITEENKLNLLGQFIDEYEDEETLDEEQKKQTFSSGNTDLEPRIWYTVIVKLVESRLEVLIDNKPVIEQSLEPSFTPSSDKSNSLFLVIGHPTGEDYFDASAHHVLIKNIVIAEEQ